MRVLFISPYPPEHDGIGSYTAALGGALRAAGHEIAVLRPRDCDERRPELIGALPSLTGATDRTVAAVDSFAPDVIHLQFAIAAYGTLLPSLLRVLRRLGAPLVVTMHEVTRDTASLPVAGRRIYRRVAEVADHIVVHTDSARRCLDGIRAPAPVPVSIVRHPRAELPAGEVTAAQLRSRLGLGNEAVVLAFGFLDVYKGLDDLIIAAGLMKAAGQAPGTRFVVAGEVRRRFGPFRLFECRDRLHAGKLGRLVRQLDLAEVFTFTGFVPSAEVGAYFELADVAVLPYLRSEQSGVASLASAAGTPLLTSDVGELPALSSLRPVPPRDPAALAARLTEYLREFPRRRPPARGGDLPEIAATTASLYRRLTAADTLPAAARPSPMRPTAA